MEGLLTRWMLLPAENSSAALNNEALLAADDSVFVHFGNEKMTPITSELRLLDTRCLGGRFSVPERGR